MPQAITRTGFRFRNVSATECELTIYDLIYPEWGVSASVIRQQLQAAGEQVRSIRLNIHSYGGSIPEGLAIYNLLKSHPARVEAHIDGIAASMASVVAMAGDEIVMPNSTG